MSYSPAIGRWMEQDPTGAEYVDGPNLYQLEVSNPVNGVDPFGLETWTRTGGTEVKEGGGEVKLKNGDTGTVTVWKNYAGKKGDTTISGDGEIELEFKTADAAKKSCVDAHWIQFTRREYFDLKNSKIDDTYESNGVYQKLNETYLDTSWTTPDSVYYDTYGNNSSSGTEMSLLDGPSLPYGAKYSKVSFIADSFLIVNKQVVFHVHWEYVGTPDANRVWSFDLTNIKGGATDSLGDFGQKQFLLGYSDAGGNNAVKYDNPLAAQN